MRDYAELADRSEIEELRVEFTDAAMMNDHERLGSLFTPDGALRIPDASIDAVGPDQISALGRQRETAVTCFVQNAHPGRIEIDGDTARGRTYTYELFQLRDGSSHVNHAIYHDRYQRTSEGWRFAERVYEIRYLDTSPLPGVSPGHGADAARSA
jgi:ketosteroid isomerase-like protein